MKSSKLEIFLWLLLHGAAFALGLLVGRGLLGFIDAIRAAI